MQGFIRWIIPLAHASLLTSTSGVLLWLAFFPVNLGPLAFVALVPLLSLVHGDANLGLASELGFYRRSLAAFFGGLVFSMLALKWICVAHPMMALFAWPGMSIYCALYWPLTLAAVRTLDRLKCPLVISFPVGVVAFEYFRTHFPTGFPFLQSVHLYQLSGFGWYCLGYTQHANWPLRQAADLGGVYIISAAVAAVNVAVFEWVLRFPPLRWAIGRPNPGWRRPTFTNEMSTTAAAVGFALLLCAYGGYRLIHKPFDLGPRVAALQGDVPQDQKNKRGEQKDGAGIITALDEVYRETLAPGAARQQPQPDLIIWPETCWSDNWYETRPGVETEPPEYTELTAVRRLRRLPEIPFAEWVRRQQEELGEQVVRKTRTSALVGLNTQDWNGTRWDKGNTALLIRPDGSSGGRYDKMHLVPFGEYVPFRETLPFMKMFSPYPWDYSCRPGEDYTRFALPARAPTKSGKEFSKEELASVSKQADERIYRFGVLICYEDSDPYLARQYNPWSGRPDPADFLINISNDGWFLGTEEHEQHLAICRFRAIEARRSVVRAVNMGISAIIDADGTIVELPVKDDWRASKGIGTRAIVSGNVPIDNRSSPYAYLGDWAPALAWLILGVGIIRDRARRRANIPVTKI